MSTRRAVGIGGVESSLLTGVWPPLAGDAQVQVLGDLCPLLLPALEATEEFQHVHDRLQEELWDTILEADDIGIQRTLRPGTRDMSPDHEGRGQFALLRQARQFIKPICPPSGANSSRDTASSKAIDGTLLRHRVSDNAQTGDPSAVLSSYFRPVSSAVR